MRLVDRVCVSGSGLKVFVGGEQAGVLYMPSPDAAAAAASRLMHDDDDDDAIVVVTTFPDGGLVFEWPEDMLPAPVVAEQDETEAP